MKSLPTIKLLEDCETLSVENDFEGILENAGLILSQEPANEGALSYMIMALYGLERYDDALAFINRMLKIDSDHRYYQYLKIKALAKSGKACDAYGFYKGLDDNSPDKEAIEILAHALIDGGQYREALDCLDVLSETNWLFSYRIVDGYKRIQKHSDIDVSGRYDEKFYLSWISMIKSKTEEESCPLCGGSYDNQFSVCEGCSEEINMSPMGTLIECDDMKIYYYICDKLHTLKEFLKEGADLRRLHEILDCLDDREFNAFIRHLKGIGYIVEASKGYIWDGDVMKDYCDEGKYAAPRWLAFPGFSAWTIGWRMGAGEDYCMNEPPRGREFGKLFPKPKNWLFNPRNPKFEKLGRIPYIGMIWDEDLNPKYSEISDDAVEVNDFITISQKGEFRMDALHFNSIEHAITYSRIASYKRLDPYNTTFKELKNDYSIADEELAHWEQFKYTVCLNVTYYLFMQDEELKRWLLSTGDKPLVYISDDEWGGDDNLFGFALMQVRDEINRLCKHEDLIDWRYTEYLKNAYPYLSHKRDVNDQQSAEYMVVQSTLVGSSRYVRDIDLSDELAGKYEPGQILTEKAFVDASSRIGGMATSHRYLILSQFMADFSRFEEETNWGLHVANRGSRFKVLDVYTVADKTQILLLQLPDGFEGVFENRTDVEEEFIERERENFKNDLEKDVIDDLTGVWLERCSFPIGMSDEGEFY